MNALHAVRDRLDRLLPSRDREHYDPFDDEDIEPVGRSEIGETTTIEYPLPDRVSSGPITARVLVVPSSGPVLELDETLYRRVGDTLEIDHPDRDLGSFDVRVRVRADE